MTIWFKHFSVILAGFHSKEYLEELGPAFEKSFNLLNIHILIA
jgi:hypothetical protein